MFRADRLTALMRAKGVSQADLARRVGVSTTAIWKLVNEPGQGSKHLHKIARVLGTTPEYLTNESDEAEAQQLGEHRLPFRGAELGHEHDPDHVMVQEFDLDYGMGGGTYLDFPVKADPVSFSRAWLRHFTKSPVGALFFARGIGDSMMPTIADADIVLIDTAQQTPRMGDQIWAIDFGGVGMIKRLRPMPDGGVKIQSDNPSIRDEVAHDGEMNVIGRVVAIVRKV